MTNKIYKQYKKEINRTPTSIIGQKAAILRNDDKVLIIKRHSKSTQSERWDFPGGRCDFSETLREGLTRETLEESGLTITKVSTPLSVTTFFRDIDINTKVIRTIYLCRASGKVKLSHEHEDYRWIDMKDHNKYTFPDIDYSNAFKLLSKLTNNNFPVTEFLFDGMLNESIELKKQIK